METMVNLKNFYKDKSILVTGHCGFKGTWLTKILSYWGAKVYGYSLPMTDLGMKEFYNLSEVDSEINSEWGDIRSLDTLQAFYKKANPDIILHLAAQPLVLDSYNNPVYTYETNVMGTVNILECIRRNALNKPLSVVNVTTDKVYENKEWEWGYRENEPLDGFDPYSNSKSCSELVTHSYKKSFLDDMGGSVSTARAGNVIGGGDFAENRIIPDCIRAALAKKPIVVRNPYSTRPYQHVLEPLYAYLLIAAVQYDNQSYANYYNVGPDEVDCITTGELVDLFCKYWGNDLSWDNKALENQPHEANLLKLDCSRMKSVFKWKPRWHVRDAVEKTVEWAKAYSDNESISILMDKQINEFLEVRNI